MSKFTHLIITRFSLPNAFGRPGPPSAAWLDHRIEIFRRFTLPSVRSQTNLDFTWILLCGAETPERHHDWLVEQMSDSDSKFRSVVAVNVNRNQLVSQLSINSGRPWLITTRLDNDDAIERDMVQRIQDQFTEQEFEFLNFTNGCTYETGRHRWRRAQHLSNPFVSLIERVRLPSPPKSVYCAKHGHIAEAGPVRQIGGKPAWMAVIHEKNCTNRPYGEPCDLAEIDGVFDVQYKASAATGVTGQ